MKRYLIALLPLFLFGFEPSSHSNAIPKKQFTPDELQPTMSQSKVESLIAQILTTYHYNKVPLDDNLSSKILDSYIKDLDGNKWYFLESDVQSFEKYRNNIDDQLFQGDLTAAYDIYNVYLKRVKSRNTEVFKLLNRSFDFKIDESYETDREKKAVWSKNNAELDDIWRKVVKGQLLDLKLSGKADTAAIKTIKERYKYFEKVINKTKSEDVFQSFINAFAESVDPHTTYFAPKAESDFKLEMQQSFEGIGATLRNEGDYVTIIEVRPGGPAAKSGLLHINDRIVGIAQGDNGEMKDIIGWLTTDAVQLIRGPKSTVVRLQLLSASDAVGTKPHEVRLVRDKIKIEESKAKAEVYPLKYNGTEYKLGVISIPLFYRDFEGANKHESDFQSTTRDVKRFLADFKTKKIDAVVIDLRNNGGGSLTEAVSLSGLFIPKGPMVQVKFSTGEHEVLDDKDPSVDYDGPLAVMVNRFSASASEIFAGAIQDYQRGIIVGEQTFGKGTVQTQVDLAQFLPKETEKLGMLKLTVQKFYRITGNSTQRKGVMPDVEFPSGFSAEEYGESSQPTALPWDEISPSRFIMSKNVTPLTVKALREKYNYRIKTDTELKQLVEDVAEFKKNKGHTTISLQEDKRKKEREEADKRRKGTKALEDLAAGSEEGEGKEKTKKDIYLKECGRILADYIAVTGNGQVVKK
jgi:carboxyl-terminal processing protease